MLTVKMKVSLSDRVGGREDGALSFRLTQILTGRGVFGSYLARIGREEATECWFCRALEDDVGHTLSECPR